ncbi:unnamed protein product [Phytophthora lilii]|uniref:Unnamed protein product n=1 Tax=Phytophthora lilii TaxID=2077276 RepID=A0A9W6TRT2_9STRA|nr:unnamed protein product [Phytophthora lilii]
MFVGRHSRQGGKESRIVQQRTKARATRDTAFELDTYLDKRDFVGALTLLRVLRRQDGDQQLTVAKTSVSNTSDVSSWRMNTWWVAYCHFHNGDFGEALLHFEQLIEAASSGDATASDLKRWRLSRACCLFYLQNFEDAEHAALSSSRSSLCNRLLFLLAHRRQHGEQALLDRYQQLSRDSIEDQLALAATSFAQLNFKEAAEIYKRLLSESNKGSQEGGLALHVYLALCYFKLGYDDVALEVVAVYLISHPDSFFATNLKASCNFRLYSAREAKPILDDYAREFPNHPCSQGAANSFELLSSNAKHSDSAMTDVMQHNIAIFRASDREANGIEKQGASAERALSPLVGHLDEAQLNLVLLYLKRREYHKAFALVEDLEPRTTTERVLKGVLHAVIGEQTHSKEHIFLAEKYLHAVGSSAEECDTIPGRQCMASYFMLRKEFTDANVYLSSISTHLSTDDAFNWNYGVSLAATGAYREAEEVLVRVQSPELRSQLVLCGWLARCYIYNDRPAQAWELYLKLENSQTAFALLKQIANDCYKAQQFFYAVKAFDVLERLDPDPEYWEGKRGACILFFRQVALGQERERGAALAHQCDEVLKLLGNSKNVLDATKLVTVLRKWRSASYAALVDADDDGTGSPLSGRKRVLRDNGLHWVHLELLLDVCLAASLLICVVVWTVLYPYAVKTGHPERILNGVSYCQHGVNVLLLQIDFFASRHLVSRDALPLVMGWPALYAVFAWIVHGTVAKGFWPYPFLQLDTPWAPFWYGGLLAAHILALMLVMMLSKIKHKQQRTVTFADQVDV